MIRVPAVRMKRTEIRLSKHQLLLTIVCTSLVWLSVDLFFFYTMSVQAKLPRDRIQGRALPSEYFNQNGSSHKRVPHRLFNEFIQVPKDHAMRERRMPYKRIVDKNGHIKVVVQAMKPTSKSPKGVEIDPADRNQLQKFIDRLNAVDGVTPHRRPKPLGLNVLQAQPQVIKTETSTPGTVTLPGLEKIRDLDVTTAPRNPKGPGEKGKVVSTPNADQDAVKKGWREASFNQYVSDKISLEREVPEVRDKKCQEKKYSYSLLPKTSVIICFTEESWSTLLRTVHSVINRSPPELLEEVILVDDFSQREYLKAPLEAYLTKFPKVKIVRLKARAGLIRARLEGVKAAKGPVLTFLDSHIECTVGWLEPLLDRIRANKTNVACPIIDTIDAATFGYVGSPATVRGIFDWQLLFNWRSVPAYENTRRAGDASAPIRSPAMAGGLFSIHKDYFYKLGQYDPGLEIWGGENIELSLKIWMCGGMLEIIPCSHVGHVFRKTQPYKFPNGTSSTLYKNTIRVAEVWLDEYKSIFYSLNPDLKKLNYGDVTDRRLLRQNLQCKSFKWYLENVYKEMHVPTMKPKAEGKLMSLGSTLCVDSMHGGQPLGMYTCHGGLSQNFRLNPAGVIEWAGQCVGRFGGSRSTNVAVMPCDSGRVFKWTHTKGGQLKKVDADRCLAVSDSGKQAVVHQCKTGNEKQKWNFGKYHST